MCGVFVLCLGLPTSMSAQTPMPLDGSAPAAGSAASPPPNAEEKKGSGRGEAFASPTFRELAITSLMLGAYDTNSNEVIDEYAKLMYCSLYQEKFKSDFEWNNIRRELGNKVRARREYFRTHYEVTGVVYLGRYSFETQDFPFIKDTALVNVGSLSLLASGRNSNNNPYALRLCGSETPSAIFPPYYIFLLPQPLTLDRIKMPMDEAEKLLQRMDVMENKERALFVRFRLRLQAAGGLDQRGIRLMMRGEMVSIDIFYDQEMTKHFATVALK